HRDNGDEAGGDECRAAVADVWSRQRTPARGSRAWLAPAVPPHVDVPRTTPARVPTRSRLWERLRGGLRWTALLDRSGERTDALALHLPPLRLVVAGARGPPPLRHLHRQPRVPSDASQRRTGGPLLANGPRPVAARTRPHGVITGRRGRHRLRRRPER